MLALIIAIVTIPLLIALGVEASKWQFFSKVASAILNLLPNAMVLWYFGIDETISCIVYGKGKV